jgi:hypothetical protein
MYRTIVLPFVWHGCETWSLTLREEPRLRVFANRVLRRIFGSKRNELTGEWRKLHNEELYDRCLSPNITGLIKPRRMRWVGHVALVRQGRGEGHTRFWWGNLRERDHLEGLGIDESVLYVFRTSNGWAGVDA